jgi:tRNA threonylcarbamoyladenosine biosynthesis protein TsaB
MIIFCIDTAMSTLSLGLWQENIIKEKHVKCDRGQAELLTPLIQEFFESSPFTFQDIDLIVTTRGPGSFTGLRIGLSTARAMAFGLNIPIVGLTNFEAINYTQPGTKNLIVLESKRADLYTQSYTDKQLQSPELLTREAIKKKYPADYTVISNLSNKIEGYQTNFCEHLNMAKLAEQGSEHYRDNPAKLGAEPFYLRPPDAKLPK